VTLLTVTIVNYAGTLKVNLNTNLDKWEEYLKQGDITGTEFVESVLGPPQLKTQAVAGAVGFGLDASAEA
jgi:hypothetical protein